MPALHSDHDGNARPRVLIAEDDSVTRLILQHWMVRWGYEIQLAQDGDQAWEMLQAEHPPELIILDWAMPGVDGIDLCRRFRSQAREYYHYILIITNRENDMDVVHARESGADDCLSKPFTQSELKARLMVASRILSLQNELIHAREELRVQAMRDGLTDLWNRKAFLDLFSRELERAARTESPTAMLLLDLDHFKAINDTHGHVVGDMVLREAAHRLKQNVRSYDFVGRYGGEEFFVALPGCDRAQLCRRAEILRRAIFEEPFLVKDQKVEVTVSIGAVVAGKGKVSPAEMLAAADRALYKAKSEGRNRTVYCEKAWELTLETLGQSVEGCFGCELNGSSSCVLPA